VTGPDGVVYILGMGLAGFMVGKIVDMLADAQITDLLNHPIAVAICLGAWDFSTRWLARTRRAIDGEER
jgi:hypothetical protein